jgi:trimethylamine--corrinoid protein Co-methyltransferase
MTLPGFIVRNPIDVLEPADLARIQTAVLDVLEHTGMVFQHDEALSLFEEAGCNVDREQQRVRFPARLVERYLSSCPSSFTLEGRDPEPAIRLGHQHCYTSTFPGKNHLDLETMEIREPTEQELLDGWRVLDALDGCHSPGYGWGSMQPVEGFEEYHNSPSGYAYFYALVAEATGKAGTQRMGGVAGSHLWTMKIAETAEVTPLGSPAASPPLTYYKDATDIILDFAKAGHPIKPVSGLAAGASAPATLAGTLVQNCAEVTGAAVLAQIVRPGLGVIMQDYSQCLDMRTGAVIQGGIERGLLGAAWCQYWRAWGIPRTTIISSDSKLPDFQCAMEKTMSAMLHAMAGSNLVSFMGCVHDELSFSPVVAIMDEEAARMMGRVFAGITVDENTLAVDVIDEVGPIPGQFLETRHTRESWKAEQLLPRVVDRLPFQQWELVGKPDMLGHAKERYEELRAEHRPAPLSDEQRTEIDDLINQSLKHYFPGAPDFVRRRDG